MLNIHVVITTNIKEVIAHLFVRKLNYFKSRNFCLSFISRQVICVIIRVKISKN